MLLPDHETYQMTALLHILKVIYQYFKGAFLFLCKVIDMPSHKATSELVYITIIFVDIRM